MMTMVTAIMMMIRGGGCRQMSLADAVLGDRRSQGIDYSKPWCAVEAPQHTPAVSPRQFVDPPAGCLLMTSLFLTSSPLTF